MSGLGSFFDSEEKRKLIAWWGGGIVVVIAGLWAVFVYVFPPKGDGGEGKREVNASHGAVSVGGNVTNSTINASPATPGETQPNAH